MIKKCLIIMAAGGIFTWLAFMSIHVAHAQDIGPPGTEVIPRGPGGPPVVHPETGPKWKIMVILEGPPGRQELTYGNQQDGIHWYASYDECEKARRGGDGTLAAGLKQLRAQAKVQRIPVEITTKCRPDTSV